MAFYTSERFPQWKGHLLVGALASQSLYRLELDGEKVVRQERMLQSLGRRIRDVRVGPDGLVYLLTDSPEGSVLRLSPR
jgi:glucose/arabinose dehydrogenase